ncbi:MAG TPA: RuvX/YqgF family protein [Candidatus Andersenbacteria bacterium]|nr:RuvX/YqgF family protein [Candidatus Andersenbacteria bacterium]
MSSVIALDIGGRYIGIAALDHSGKIPYRFKTIDRKQESALDAIKKICEQEDVITIVAGVPYHVEDGSETEQTRKTRAFIAELKSILPEAIDYIEIDETLTSQEAKRLLGIEGAPAAEEHAEAARILLSEYLAKL